MTNDGKKILILSDARGRYIPRDFVCNEDATEPAKEHCDRWHIDQEDREILMNPEHEHYWETWESVENYAFFEATEADKILPGTWTLYQDGDLYAIHEDYVWED